MNLSIRVTENVLDVRIKVLREFEGVLVELVVLHQEVHDGHPVLDVVHDRRVLLDLSEGETLHSHLRFFQLFDRVPVECMVTPHTDGFVARCLLPAVRARERRVVFGVLCFDILPMERGVLFRAVLAVHRDVSRDGFTAAFAALAVLDETLVLPESRQPRRITLPEVLRGNGLLKTDSVRGPLEVPHERRVRHPLAVVLHPEVGVVVARSGVVIPQPPIQIRDRQYHRNRPLAGLPIDLDFSTIGGLLDVTYSEFVQLAVRAESTLERRREQRFVPHVRRPVVDEWEDVGLPVEHIRSRRARLVVPGGIRVHPVDGFRWVSLRPASERVLPDGADCEAVVAFRPRVLVGTVDPADDRLSSLTLLEGVSKATDLLGCPRCVTEQFFVAVVGVVVQVELVGEEEERVDVFLRDRIVRVLVTVVEVGRASRADSLSKCVDLLALSHQSGRQSYGQDLTIRLESRPRLRVERLNPVFLKDNPRSVRCNRGELA